MALVKLDMSKAYDTVIRSLLWASMEESGLPKPFVQLMKSLYHDSAYVVRVNGQMSPEFLSGMGLPPTGRPPELALGDGSRGLA